MERQKYNHDFNQTFKNELDNRVQTDDYYYQIESLFNRNKTICVKIICIENSYVKVLLFINIYCYRFIDNI